MRKGSTFRILRVLLPCFLVISGTFVVVHPAFADATSTASDAARTAMETSAWLQDYLMTAVAEFLNVIAGGLGKLALVLIEVLIVPILNYNSFSTSTVIGLGWSLMRDIVNMFVIIALLAIAILTIVGNERAHWEQQLPRLFLAVVLVNFSRTICGLLIDVSQVVMFTFVNALLDIAAGNFAQLLSLNEFGKISDITAATAASSTVDAVNAQLNNGASNLINAFLQIPLYGSVVIILLLLAIAFVYRIVILWILVILSPAAFFLGGMHDVFHIGGAHAWWEKFTGALVMGPLLTFFLWLALAASSAGSITQTENFPVPDSPQTYGLALQAFQSDSIVSTIVALILLIVGMQQAGSYAGRVGGIAGQMINEGVGRRVVTESAKFLPVTVGGRAARTADRYLAPPGSVTFSQALGKDVIAGGSAIAKGSSEYGRVAGAVGLGLGRTIMAAGGKMELSGEHAVHADTEAAKARVAAMSDTQKAEEYSLIAIGKNSKLLGRRDDYEALAADFVTKGKMQKETKDHIKHHHEEEHKEENTKRILEARKTAESNGQDQDAAAAAEQKKIDQETNAHVDALFDPIMKGALAAVDKKKSLLLDDSGKQKFYETASKHVDLLEDPKKFIDSDDFVVAKLRDRPAVLDNKDVVEALNKKVVRVNKGGEKITAMDQIKAGLAGEKMREKANGMATPDVEYSKEIAKVGGPDRTRLEKSFAEGGAKSVTLENMSIAGDVITTAAVNANVKVDDLGSASGAEAVKVRQQFQTNITNHQKADIIERAIINKQVDPRNIPITAYDKSTNPNRGELVSGLLQAQPDLKPIPTFGQAAITRAVEEMRAANELSTEQITRADAMLIDMKGKIEDVISGLKVSDPARGGAPSLSGDAEARISHLIKEDIANVRHLRAVVPLANNAPSNDITQVIARDISTEDIDRLAVRIAKTKGSAQDELKKSLAVIANAVQIEHGRTPPARPGATPRQVAQRDRLEELADHAATVKSRYP